MTYFDLNIPYDESNNTRLKLAAKSIELGYTAVAYNRSIKGVMSDRDLCSIPLLPLSSLLKLSPNLQTSANFHRELLGVPVTAPFRQYTRLTVLVDSLVQCQALSKGNLVLKSYDLVAVRPVNQVAFDCVCDSAEVDLISIDFTGPLPFKMKFQNLQAALKRGVYFEITYSPLISDVLTRRQIIQTTQLLVQWTCGKNLILSSGAASVSEIRGPCDVANLSTLLGISTERAKAALSKNCRSLLLNGVRKNQCYNNAVKVEKAPSIKSGDSKEAWFCDENDWDHISSSEGDVLLDQIAKSFAASSEVPKAKAVGSTSRSNKKPSHGTQLKGLLPVSYARVHPSLSLSASKEFGGSTDTGQVFEQLNKLKPDRMAGRMLLASSFRNQLSGGQDFLKSPSRNDILAVSRDDNGIVPLAPGFEESNGSGGAVPVTVEISAQGKASKDCELECAHVTSKKDTQAFYFHEKSRRSPDVDILPSSSIPVCTIENNPVDSSHATGTGGHSTPSKETTLTFSCNKGDTRHNGSDLVLGAHDMGLTEILHDTEKCENTSAVLVGCGMSVDNDHANGNKHVEHNDCGVSHGDDKLLIESLTEMQADKHSHAEVVPPEGALVESDDREKLNPGTHNKKSERIVRQNCTDPNLKERFIELCIQEFDSGGRSAETLTLSSWVRIRKRIKTEFGNSYSVRKLKKRFEHLKKQNHISASLIRNLGHNYSAETNTIELSPKTREENQQMRIFSDNSEGIGEIDDSPHKNDIQLVTEALSVQQNKAPLNEPVDLKSNNLSCTPPHSEFISCAKVKSRRDGTVRSTGKVCKRRRVASLLTS